MHYQAFYEQNLREASSRNELYELSLVLYMLYVIMLLCYVLHVLYMSYILYLQMSYI